MTRKGERYWERRNAGLCVACGVPTDKSRCPTCMKYLSYATSKSGRERIRRLEERIKSLEGGL
jgi:predicted amidophosphoribosyltransferase